MKVAPAPELRFVTADLVLGSRGRGEDRVAVVPCAGAMVLVVADGAGGMGGGAAAAEAVIAEVRASAEALVAGALEPASLLRQLDQRGPCTPRQPSSGGQCTAVIAIVNAEGIAGASVGDSGALHARHDALDDLTAGQAPKPLIGSGAAAPVAFAAPPLDGTLLLATDGLLKYASWKRLHEALRHPWLDELPSLLSSLVRLPSGALQDDVGIVVCRCAA